MIGTNLKVSTILVIDDAEDIHRLLRLRLRGDQVRILGARSPAEGLDQARRVEPDLILLDIELPEMDGFKVLAQLKDDPETHEIPVIFLSGSNRSEEKVRGFMLGAVDFVTKPFDIAELRARVRAALHTRHLMQMLAKRAQIDGLTGLWNRAHFDQRLREAISAARRNQEDLCLLMSDIDHFKSLNDNHGHPFGDDVLTVFADEVLAQIRENDVACRYGGEEFAVILPSTTLGPGRAVAERCRTALQTRQWPGREDLVVTTSVGVAALSQCPERTPDAFVAAADGALYAAKNAGRNRVVVHEPDALQRAG